MLNAFGALERIGETERWTLVSHDYPRAMPTALVTRQLNPFDKPLEYRVPMRVCLFGLVIEALHHTLTPSPSFPYNHDTQSMPVSSLVSPLRHAAGWCCLPAIPSFPQKHFAANAQINGSFLPEWDREPNVYTGLLYAWTSGDAIISEYR